MSTSGALHAHPSHRFTIMPGLGGNWLIDNESGNALAPPIKDVDDAVARIKAIVADEALKGEDYRPFEEDTP